MLMSRKDATTPWGLTLFEDSWTVNAMRPAGIAERSGLREGDQILQVNGISVYSPVARSIMGAQAVVHLDVQRPVVTQSAVAQREAPSAGDREKEKEETCRGEGETHASKLPPAGVMVRERQLFQEKILAERTGILREEMGRRGKINHEFAVCPEVHHEILLHRARKQHEHCKARELQQQECEREKMRKIVRIAFGSLSPYPTFAHFLAQQKCPGVAGTSTK